MPLPRAQPRCCRARGSSGSQGNDRSVGVVVLFRLHVGILLFLVGEKELGWRRQGAGGPVGALRRRRAELERKRRFRRLAHERLHLVVRRGRVAAIDRIRCLVRRRCRCRLLLRMVHAENGGPGSRPYSARPFTASGKTPSLYSVPFALLRTLFHRTKTCIRLEKLFEMALINCSQVHRALVYIYNMLHYK